MSKYFDEYLRVAPFSHALWRASEAEAISNIKIERPILDIGCGFGEFGGIFFDSTVDIGLDKSERDFDIAKKRGIYEKVILADATKLPIEDDSINTCISISTLEHIKNPNKVIEEAYRVLKPKGKLIITVPTLEINNNLIGCKIFKKIGLNFLSNTYIKIYHKVFKHETIVPKDKWIDWISKAGFNDISVKNTLSKEHVAIFEMFLISGSISQIMRNIFGKRMIVNFKARTRFMTFLYNKINNKERDHDSSNIVIVASK